MKLLIGIKTERYVFHYTFLAREMGGLTVQQFIFYYSYKILSKLSYYILPLCIHVPFLGIIYEQIRCLKKCFLYTCKLPYIFQSLNCKLPYIFQSLKSNICSTILVFLCFRISFSAFSTVCNYVSQQRSKSTI
jgi:hypothetical protein